MALLVDLFGYLTIIIHAFTIVTQSMALGSVFFLLFLARPFAASLGEAGPLILRDSWKIALAAMLALVVFEAATIALQAAILVGTVDLTLPQALGASSALAGLVKIGATLAMAVLLFARRDAVPAAPMLAFILIELVAATMTTHAAARFDDRALLFAATLLHQLGAAIWIGGIPIFLVALARIHEAGAWRIVGARFSLMSQLGVAAIFLSAAVFTWFYIGAPDALYGTAYGVMVGAKIAMFGCLLALGYANSRTVARLKTDRSTSVLRMKRFAEVEVGIGLAVFFAAASLTSAPPSVDLTEDRVSWAEVVERNTPAWPRLVSPDHDDLAIIKLQAQLDAEAAATRSKPQAAFTPGSGDLPDRNAADIGWSEFNHHWAGIFVALIGITAMLNQAGVRAARHWPLLLLLMAGFLFVRSDPEAWPLGQEGFWESMRDIEALQHRFFVVLLVLFAVFEWRVRAGSLAQSRAALVFPIITTLGGVALLTHSHAISNVKDALLIELTHTPLALAGVGAGLARWVEIRLPGRAARIAGWTWPALFIFIGLLLLSYRET